MVRGNLRYSRGVVLLSLMLLVGSPVVRGVDFAGGTGEPNDPYLIATAEQLLAADFTVPGTYFRLCNNIDLDGRIAWGGSFRAHLDGAGYEIQNAIRVMGGSIFDCVEAEGTITNLVLANFDVGLVLRSGHGTGGAAGGLATANAGTISNCGAIGWVATSGVSTVGGLVGSNYGSIINCYFDGWVDTDWEVRSSEDEGISSRAGGLVGSNGGLIANSLARGFVVGRTGCGGLVGCNYGTINNCYATCTVIGDVGSGGLVADNWGSLRNCYAMGEVMGQMRGGLVGMAGRYAGSATNCLWDISLTRCPRSGAGIGCASLLAWIDFALNGWAGDPNWVMKEDWSNRDSYPRLAWEGTDGEIVAPTSFPFLEGSGTRNDPYVIRTRYEVGWLCQGSIYWDKHFVLANDLDDVGSFWPFSAIGVCSGSSFSGTFDGQGHVIRGLWVEGWIDDQEATAWNLGLFGYVTGEIRNLRLEKAVVTGGVNSSRVGLLVGTSEGVIENCSASGSLAVGEKSRFIGGLIGLDIGEVRDCEATVTIEAGEGSTDIGEVVGASHPVLP
jgi:hypothetical protein